ncbi:hypothetical protein [Huintestinicola sp.]|uniref:hypothetical protein n=1 Tax=Huintestinicola sp. TaxID=2981661 RepID=UPI003D7E731A
MNAAKAKKNPAKFKGAVLIMILAVMTVLIILLAGSIAVVYSTNQRVNQKYEENQAYYTMRSTLNACLDNILDNSSDALSWQDVYYYEGGGDPIKVLKGNASPCKLKRGRYEECVLYQVPICTETTGSNANLWYKKQKDAGKISDESEVNITATDLGGAGTAITSDSDFNGYKSQYAVKYDWSSSLKPGEADTVVYTFDLSTIADMSIDDSGDMVAKMLDAGANDKITVKLQVLERQYDLGGSVTDPIGKRFILGDRKKDYFRIKATCEANYNGQSYQYTVYLSTKEPEPKINGVSSLSKMNPGSKIRMINEANSLENTTYNFDNNSVTTGNVSLFGNLNLTASGTELVIENEQVFMVTGTFNSGTNSEGVVFAQDGSSFYCENAIAHKPFTHYNHAKGNFICSDSYLTSQSGCVAQEITFFVNNFIYNDNNPPSGTPTGTSWYNNIYITGPESTFIDTSVSGTVKAKKALRDLLGTSTFSGTLNFGSLGPTGTASDFSVTTSYDFNPTHPGYMTFVSDRDMSNPADHEITYDHSKVLKLDYDSDSSYDTSTFKRKITLPGNLGGLSTNVLELKTQRSIFNERFDSGAWNATDNGTFASTTQSFLWSHLLPRDTLPASTARHASGTGVPGVSGGTIKIANDPSDADFTNPTKYTNLTFDSIITKDDGILELKGQYSGDILFDTTDGDITVVFKDVVKGRFYVNGENTLKIYLTSSSGQLDLGGTDHQFMLVDFNTINVKTHAINQLAGAPRGSKTQLYVCDDSSHNPLVKTMVVYKLDTNGVGGVPPVICAQIDAPKTDFRYDSSGGTNYTLTLADSGYTLQTIPIAIMGSAFTNSYNFDPANPTHKTGEDRGIWSMIPPDDPGEKTINLYKRYR